MNKKKKIIIVVSILAFITIFAILIMIANNINKNNSQNVEATNIELSLDSSDINTSASNVSSYITLADNNTKVNGSGVTVSENTVTITSGGNYYISGTLSNGNIVITTDKNEEVQLILSNVSITSSQTSAINCTQASKLIITLEEGTSNYLEDATTYKYSSSSETEPDATIFTKSDLTINGAGSLTVQANYEDGIVSKDSLKIVSGNITITSADDGIRGKDSVSIAADVTLNITSNGDAIKSTNTEDSTLGYVLVEGGNITINSKQDAIQAETILSIKGGTINIITGGGSSITSTSSSSWGSWGMASSNSSSSKSDTSSSKGLKAGSQINIENANITIDSSDDSIHSNNNIIIRSGIINISSGDDGIHADSNLKIDDGTITISKSYEGLESVYIEINGGVIVVNSEDDGVNSAGGNDSSSTNGRVGQNNFSSTNSNNKICINGGTLTVNAQGDGLDANGSIYIAGGTITVYGPTENDNGSLDYDSECQIIGGKVILIGSSGMLQAPSTSSTQCSITFTQTGSSGDNIVLTDSNGNEIVSFTAQKIYGAMTISAPEMKQGETYIVKINGSTVKTVSQSSIVVSSGISNFGGIMQGGKNK